LNNLSASRSSGYSAHGEKTRIFPFLLPSSPLAADPSHEWVLSNVVDIARSLLDPSMPSPQAAAAAAAAAAQAAAGVLRTKKRRDVEFQTPQHRFAAHSEPHS
jgi:hypothetical protein